MQHEIEIEKPLRDVCAAFRDPDNLPRWLQGLQRTEQISGEPGKVGSVTKQIYLERGRLVEMIETITAHEPETFFAGTLEAPGLRSTLRVDFEARGDRTLQAQDLQTFKQLVEAGEL